MRTLLAIVVTACAILMAGIAQVETVWWIATLLIAAVWLLHRLGTHERRAEHQAVQQTVWADVLTVASSAQQQRQAQPAEQDQDPR